MTDYDLLCAQLRSLIHGVPHQTANLANASALLYEALPDLNWAGFYLLEGETLVRGPIQGKPACIEIPVGKGVCGAAVAEGRTQRVEGVPLFPGHIACDSASNAEIVVPHRAPGRIPGVLDRDRPPLRRGRPAPPAGLEKFASILEEELWG